MKGEQMMRYEKTRMATAPAAATGGAGGFNINDEDGCVLRILGLVLGFRLLCMAVGLCCIGTMESEERHLEEDGDITTQANTMVDDVTAAIESSARDGDNKGVENTKRNDSAYIRGRTTTDYHCEAEHEGERESERENSNGSDYENGGEHDDNAGEDDSDFKEDEVNKDEIDDEDKVDARALEAEDEHEHEHEHEDDEWHVVYPPLRFTYTHIVSQGHSVVCLVTTQFAGVSAALTLECTPRSRVGGGSPRLQQTKVTWSFALGGQCRNDSLRFVQEPRTAVAIVTDVVFSSYVAERLLRVAHLYSRRMMGTAPLPTLGPLGGFCDLASADTNAACHQLGLSPPLMLTTITIGDDTSTCNTEEVNVPTAMKWTSTVEAYIDSAEEVASEQESEDVLASSVGIQGRTLTGQTQPQEDGDDTDSTDEVWSKVAQVRPSPDATRTSTTSGNKATFDTITVVENDATTDSINGNDTGNTTEHARDNTRPGDHDGNDGMNDGADGDDEDGVNEASHARCPLQRYTNTTGVNLARNVIRLVTTQSAGMQVTLTLECTSRSRMLGESRCHQRILAAWSFSRAGWGRGETTRFDQEPRINIALVTKSVFTSYVADRLSRAAHLHVQWTKGATLLPTIGSLDAFRGPNPAQCRYLVTSRCHLQHRLHQAEAAEDATTTATALSALSTPPTSITPGLPCTPRAVAVGDAPETASCFPYLLQSCDVVKLQQPGEGEKNEVHGSYDDHENENEWGDAPDGPTARMDRRQRSSASHHHPATPAQLRNPLYAPMKRRVENAMARATKFDTDPKWLAWRYMAQERLKVSMCTQPIWL